MSKFIEIKSMAGGRKITIAVDAIRSVQECDEGNAFIEIATHHSKRYTIGYFTVQRYTEVVAMLSGNMPVKV